MVRPSELRIDNVLCDAVTGRWYRLATLSGNDNFTKMQIGPIALTPPILEMCGFKKESSTYEPNLSCYTLKLSEVMKSHDKFELIAYFVNKPMGDYKKGDCSLRYSVNGVWASNEILYLHNLQNFYFELTGIELEIKESAFTSSVNG